MKKTRIYLNEAEWRFLIHSLNELRTKLISEVEQQELRMKLCYSIIEAGGLPETNIAGKSTIVSNRESISKQNGFQIERMRRITGTEKVAANTYSGGDIDLVNILKSFCV